MTQIKAVQDKMTILCDMDGVLADFIQGLARISPANQTTTQNFNPPLGWEIHQHFGFSNEAEMWAKVDDHGPEFWAELPELPWARELADYLMSLGVKIAICTSPSSNAVCSHGKVLWLQKFFGPDFRDYVLTPRKQLLGRPYNLLLDDADHQVAKFRKAGGAPCLWPAPWNKAAEHATADGSGQMQYIRPRIERWLDFCT